MIKKGELYYPTPEFKKKAIIKNSSIYKKAAKNPIKFWEKLAKEELKDPKAVELLKRGQNLQPNEWKNPEQAADWPKLRDATATIAAGGLTRTRSSSAAHSTPRVTAPRGTWTAPTGNLILTAGGSSATCARCTADIGDCLWSIQSRSCAGPSS